MWMTGGMLVPLAIVVLVIWLIFRGFQGWPGGSRAENPLDIIKVRYARGEISREEYDRMREELKTL